MLRIGIPLLAILLIFAALVTWLSNSDYMPAARQLLTQNPRVRAEFGDDAAMPFAVGWMLDRPDTYGYVKGSQAGGWAYLELDRDHEPWEILQGRVYDITEDHLLQLFRIRQPSASPTDRCAAHRLYLVAMGSSAHHEVQDLADFLETECGVHAEVLPDMDLPDQGFDAPRNQWIAEMLIDAIVRNFPDIAGDEEARFMAVIDSDSYPRSLGWDYTFNYRYANKYAVLQTAPESCFLGPKIESSYYD